MADEDGEKPHHRRSREGGTTTVEYTVTRSAVIDCLGACYPNVRLLRFTMDRRLVYRNELDQLLKQFPKLEELHVLLHEYALPIGRYVVLPSFLNMKLRKLVLISVNFPSAGLEDAFLNRIAAQNFGIDQVVMRYYAHVEYSEPLLKLIDNGRVIVESPYPHDAQSLLDYSAYFLFLISQSASLIGTNGAMRELRFLCALMKGVLPSSSRERRSESRSSAASRMARAIC